MDCVKFLQWALPHLDLSWQGLRKVRGQVCKRIQRRLQELSLKDLIAYRQRLQRDPDEWHKLDGCCHITISRFYRDRGVFDALQERILPEIALQASRAHRAARALSVGCASGEEVYTLRILWDLKLACRVPGTTLSIIATDIDDKVLRRAHGACYPSGCLRELAPCLREQAFTFVRGQYCVRPQHRNNIEILKQDVRTEMPQGPFDLVLCRNLAFTYFTPELQKIVLDRILRGLAPHGYLVIGSHEHLPLHTEALVAKPRELAIFQLAEERNAP